MTQIHSLETRDTVINQLQSNPTEPGAAPSIPAGAAAAAKQPAAQTRGGKGFEDCGGLGWQ
jgi:hypothetical protein